MGWMSWRFSLYGDYATEEYVSIPGRWKTIFFVLYVYKILIATVSLAQCPLTR